MAGEGGRGMERRRSRPASRVALGGDDLERPVLLVHRELARPVHHEQQQRADLEAKRSELMN